ncbi:MAG: electron transfer flavoprotein subunit beta/FixA family protein [Gammaproteobacteria bacterium]|nr:electron transfer flavoprotein subunit beta/FixA family protein [Gammaproteobacteria bacterium]
MKILVPIKRVVDANVKVRVLADHTGVDLNNVKMAMNPFCEIAIEEAVRLKEKGLANEIIAITVGDEKSQEQLRTAMALGADRSIWIEQGGAIEPLAIAKLLKAVVDKETPDLIILGKQSIDGDNNQVGQMLAAMCDMPQGTFAFNLEIAEGRAIVSREVDGGEQIVSLSLPAVVTTDLRLNEPRYAKLPDIMKAKKKPLEHLTAQALGINITSSLTLLSVNEPPARAAGVLVASTEELVNKLRHEARVIQ